MWGSSDCKEGLETPPPCSVQAPRHASKHASYRMWACMSRKASGGKNRQSQRENAAKFLDKTPEQDEDETGTLLGVVPGLRRKYDMLKLMIQV